MRISPYLISTNEASGLRRRSSRVCSVREREEELALTAPRSHDGDAEDGGNAKTNVLCSISQHVVDVPYTHPTCCHWIWSYRHPILSNALPQRSRLRWTQQNSRPSGRQGGPSCPYGTRSGLGDVPQTQLFIFPRRPTAPRQAPSVAARWRRWRRSDREAAGPLERTSTTSWRGRLHGIGVSSKTQPKLSDPRHVTSNVRASAEREAVVRDLDSSRLRSNSRSPKFLTLPRSASQPPTRAGPNRRTP